MTREPALYLHDSEVAKLIGLDPKTFAATVAVLEKGGFPKPDPLFQGKRYWPAVKAFLDRRHGVGSSSAPLQPDGEENWNAPEQRRPRLKSQAA